MNEEKVSGNKQLIDSLVKEQPVTNAVQKLDLKNLEVSVYRHTSSVQLLEEQLAQVKTAIASVEDTKQLVVRQKQIEVELEKHEKNKIEGVLTPLFYRELNLVKALVTEMVVDCRKYNIEADVIMARLVAQERFATVFFTLKKKDSPKERYFGSLEDISMVDDDTISDIFNIWDKYFVLTDDELKN